MVGFNNLRFDYEVLHGYTPFDLRQLPTLDMLVELQNNCSTGSRSTPSRPRPSAWRKPPRACRPSSWFKEGKLVEIAEYCCYDVKLTKLVHEYGAQHRQLHYQNKFGKKLTVPVNWSV